MAKGRDLTILTMKITVFRQIASVAVFVLVGFLGEIAAQHSLVFYARPPSWRPFSLGGHAFVSWVTEDSLHLFSEKTYGFYPIRPCTMMNMWFKTPGHLVPGFERNMAENLSTKAQSLAVTAAVFKETEQVALGWKKTYFHLFTRNCLDMMDEVAESIGLRTPKTRLLFVLPKSPVKYLRQLKTMNQDWDFADPTLPQVASGLK